MQASLQTDLCEMATVFSGVYGVCAQRIGREDQVAWQADESFPTASVIKVPILVTCLHHVQQGLRSLDEMISLSAHNQVIGSGILKELHVGLKLTLEDLLILMIAISDNTATNTILDLVTPEQVNAYMVALGHRHTMSVGKLFSDTGGRLSATTPRDMVNLLVQLATAQILTAPLCRKAIDILSKQQFTEIITRSLPYDPFSNEEGAAPSIAVASKSGAIRGVRNDVGIVTTPSGSYAIALMSKECADRRFHPDNEAKIFLADISRRLYEHFNPTVS